MTDETSPAPFPRRLRRQLEGSARRGARRLRDHPRLGRLIRPTVSVILPIYNVEDYLAACLDSIAEQDFTHYELLVVDDGSPDGSRAIAEQYAARDHRIRIITRENGGLGAARNTGIRHARGRFLTFVDSDDKLPDHALRALVDSARASGSDIVVGSVRRFDEERDWRPDWVNRVHHERRTGITVEEFHPLLRNLYTWNKLFRRDFWTAQDLWFRERVAYEDQPIITQLYLRARSIDVIPEVVYAYREREDRSSISQQTASLKDLTARITAFELTREALRAEASDEMYLAWLQTLFDSHLHWYLMSSGVTDPTYWQTIREAVVDFTEGAPRQLWDRTPPVRRVLLELARQDRREDLQELVWSEFERVEDSPTTPVPDGVLLQLPFLGDERLPDELFLMRPEQLKQAHAIDKVRWVRGEDGEVGCYLS
ncbi:glycosyltransferase family 2 protein, partial [Nocardioides sp.]|uniref:glycosyltransferase family 2 protein n=1 Tax=Nocardioides sp. TaxID=35761 RepID=UPI0027369D96